MPRRLRSVLQSSIPICVCIFRTDSWAKSRLRISPLAPRVTMRITRSIESRSNEVAITEGRGCLCYRRAGVRRVKIWHTGPIRLRLRASATTGVTAPSGPITARQSWRDRHPVAVKSVTLIRVGVTETPHRELADVRAARRPTPPEPNRNDVVGGAAGAPAQ
jgi:hypothetical protein